MENKIKTIVSSFEFKKFDNGKECYIITDNCEPKLKDIIMTLIYDDVIGGTHDLSYEIVAKACEWFEDHDKESEDFITEYEPSSIYTNERLSYLNANNDSDIMDIIKEYQTSDISTACAVWYDNQVQQAISTIISEYLN